MGFALNTYMSRAGIRLRETRPPNTAEKAQSAPDKDKWLPFFPKTKKVTELPKTGASLGEIPALRQLEEPSPVAWLVLLPLDTESLRIARLDLSPPPSSPWPEANVLVRVQA